MVILGQECFLLAMYLATRKNSVDLGVLLVVWGLSWGPPGSQVGGILPLGPPEVGGDRNRFVGGDARPRVPHTTANIEKL